MAQAPDREKALELALAQIEKSHGKGSVMRLGEEVRQPISVIPTGSIALDVALGIGGLPRGRVVEIYGPESSGKTTVALHAVANAQAAGGIAAFIDAEHALDPDYAKRLGVDTDSLLVSQPDTGDQDVQRAGADQHVGDLERLLTGVGLGHQQRVRIHAELLGVIRIQRVLGVDERGDATCGLGVGHRVQRDGCLLYTSPSPRDRS